MKLGEVADRINKKNTGGVARVLTISAQYGLVEQEDFFSKRVSSVDLSNYILVKKGEFAYNKSYSHGYPWGAIKRLDQYAEGVLSPLYICFRLKDDGVDSDYLQQYFEGSQWHKEISLIAMEGARNHGLLNITIQDFFNLPLRLPSLAEQRKIAGLLSLIDERIEVQNAIIKEREAQKASLLRRLFDRTLRFPEFTDKWKKVKLGEVGKMYNGLSGKKAADFGAGYPFITYKMVFDSGVIDMSKVSYVEIGPGEKQNKVREGDIFFTTSSETIDEVGMSSVLLRDADNLFLNSFCFGYRLNTPNLTTSQYLGYMLRGPQMRMRISSLGQGITRFNISKEKVADLQIAVPTLPEQRKIAALLSAIDERLDVERAYAEQLKQQKAYLLRQMFI